MSYLLHLRMFLEIYRAGSLTRAAERLGITQPAASGHLATLEATLGKPLFLRQANSYSLVNKPWDEIGALTIVTSFLVVVALIAVTALALRRRDRVAAAAGVTALLALIVATVTFARLPEQPFDVARYRVLEMLIVGAFIWFATIFGTVRALPATLTERPAVQWTAIAGAAVILVAMPFATASADSPGCCRGSWTTRPTRRPPPAWPRSPHRSAG